MVDEEVLGHNSPEIKELLHMMQETDENMGQGVENSQPLLDGERYMGNKEVCSLLHISMRSLQEYRDRGKIAFYKLEGKILYAESDVYRMLENYYNKAWE